MDGTTDFGNRTASIFLRLYTLGEYNSFFFFFKAMLVTMLLCHLGAAKLKNKSPVQREQMRMRMLLCNWGRDNGMGASHTVLKEKVKSH